MIDLVLSHMEFRKQLSSKKDKREEESDEDNMKVTKKKAEKGFGFKLGGTPRLQKQCQGCTLEQLSNAGSSRTGEKRHYRFCIQNCDDGCRARWLEGFGRQD